MAKIVKEEYYDGARAKIDRLGLWPLINEIKAAVASFKRITSLLSELSDLNYNVRLLTESLIGEGRQQSASESNEAQVLLKHALRSLVSSLSHLKS